MSGPGEGETVRFGSGAGSGEEGDGGDALRALVVAAAGSGKTYQLSSRLLGLLASGVPPEQILASTFTRKAAGEILERVLERLSEGALDPDEARALAASLPAWSAAESVATPEGCQALLAQLAGRLHRLQVYTLDAFFHRAVSAFALELGLSGRWEVADEVESERIRVRAVERVLEELGPGQMAGILRAIGRGRVQSAVHRGLLDELSSLHQDYRSLAPGIEDPWGIVDATTRFPAADPAEWEALANVLPALELPRNKGNGKVPAHWSSNIERIGAGLRAMDGSAVLGSGLIGKRLAGEGAFSGHEITVEVGAVLDRIVARVQDHQLSLLDRAAREMGRFVERYHHEVLRLRREEGRYEFGDLAFSLIEGGATRDPLTLYYRLDGEVRHLLLDEFQDTSVVQWRALEPLVGEILSGYEGERAVYLVGDPKQSIYGWRGGEPRILERVEERYGLTRSALSVSWRSSPVILDLVNRVFGTLPENPAFERDEEGAAVVEWMGGFEEHRAQFTDRPGHWTIEVAPAGTDEEEAADDDEIESGKEALLRRTAERVAELHRTLPGATIGVLTRQRKPGATILAHLKSRGIEASGEGGVPLTDSPPVLAILALLRMIDHPGDGPSRYLVGQTALGERVGLSDWASASEAQRVGSRLRERLLDEDYGAVVGGWVRELLPHEGERDRARLRQLAEFAAEWESRATLRTMDFVRAVEGARRELPGGGAIRIMTIHASKGLQFDVVVIPELGSSWRRGRGPTLLADRPDPTGPVERMVPRLPDGLIGRAPEVARVTRDAAVASLRDDLSALYVAITRTRYALHVVIPPDGKSVSSALSGARVLRAALDDPGARAEPETIWAEGGDPEWWRQEAPEGEARRLQALRQPRRGVRDRSTPKVTLAPSPRRRLLERLTPSGLEGGVRVPLDRVLRRPARGALDRGSLVHRWLEEVEWLPADADAGAGGTGAADPWRDRLRELARETAPGYDEVDTLIDRFLEWIAVPAVSRFLRAAEWPGGTTVQREVPFVVRHPDGLLQGIADRVLRVPDPEGDRLVVIDWKTDAVVSAGDPLLDERIEHYTPQLEAYRGAMARVERVPESRVEGWLVFVAAGESVRV